jgi:hypothetical protein
MKVLSTIATLLLASVLTLGSAFAQSPSTETKIQLAKRVYAAVTLLYSQDESGGMRMHCTATAYRKTGDVYRFVSAAHCVTGNTDEEQKETHFFVTADTNGKTKSFIPAKLLKAGDKNAGDDFSIFEVTTTEKFEVIPLGTDITEQGAQVIDVASPLGLGLQYFEGYVSAPKLDRPALDAGEVKWSNVALIQIGSGPGSSGSSIVSVDQKAIVAFLVGAFNTDIGKICVPVSTFKAFEAKVDAGTYKKHLRFNFSALFGGGD